MQQPPPHSGSYTRPSHTSAALLGGPLAPTTTTNRKVDATQLPVHPSQPQQLPLRPAVVSELLAFGTSGVASSAPPPPRHVHPLLESMMHALGSSGARTARPSSSSGGGAELTASSHVHGVLLSGSQTARSASASTQHAPSLRALPPQSGAVGSHSGVTPAPRRQTAAAMRRKLASLEHAQLPLSPAHAAALQDVSPAAAVAAGASASTLQKHSINSGGVAGLPPSLLPASARTYTRPPLTNFVVSLDSLPPSQRRQWEQQSFPSLNPLAPTADVNNIVGPAPSPSNAVVATAPGQAADASTSNSGSVASSGAHNGESEVRRLAAWFEQAWASLEQNAQRQGARERQQQARRQAAAKAAQRAQLQQPGAVVPQPEEEKVSSSLSPALLHQLDLNREKLVFVVFHELLRHVSAFCRRRGALLEKIWQAQRRLEESKAAHRVNEVVSLAEAHARAQMASTSAECAALVRAEHASALRLGVDLDASRAALQSKARIIASLSEENDRDLLYSNQQVCLKEMALLRAERELVRLEAERAREREAHKFLEAERTHLEASLANVEGERDELAAQATALQNLLDERLRAQVHQETQWDASDAPPEPSAEELVALAAATAIQRTFRGWATRRRLKQKGLLSRRVLLRKLQAVHSSAVAAHTAANGANGGGIVLPSIPRAFASLMSAQDCARNRAHFMRLFARRNLLKWIGHLYAEKSFADAAAAKAQQPRRELAVFIYEHYLLRHGTRDAAEMDLLDLFASVDKHAESSARIRLFAMLINNACRHRRIFGVRANSALAGTGTTNTAAELPASPLASPKESNKGDVASHLANNANTTTNNSINTGSGFSYSMSSSERATLELKFGLSVSLSGGRSLNARVLDFLLRFTSAARRLGRGPFQSVSDNNDGVTWIALDSMEELVSRAWARLPSFMLKAVIAKMRHRADNAATRMAPTAAAGTAASYSAPPSSAASAVASSDTLSDPRRFVDYDALVEVLVESFIDEDARMHHTLLDIFAQQNPTAEPAIGRAQRDRAHAKRNVAAAAAAVTATVSTVDPADVSSNTDIAASGGASSALEPEFFSFPHFAEVLRALGVSWTEDRLLRVFAQSVQRAAFRAVSLDDFVTTVRCYAVLPVDIDWQRLEGEADSGAAAAAASAAAVVELGDGGVELPPLLDEPPVSSSSGPTSSAFPSHARGPSSSGGGGCNGELDAEFHRRHQDLKDRLRELEASSHTKLAHASRRHERELAALRAAHDKELEGVLQMHAHQTELHKRALEAEKARSAADYNALFDSGANELRAAQQRAESKEARAAALQAASLAHFQTKLSEEAATLQLVQAKLASKTDKYNKKKAALQLLQAKCAKLEAQLQEQQAAKE